MRTWAFADGPQWNALQPSPGVFDERVFCALDRVVAEAGARGIRILFNLTNFWSDYGGMGQYVAWSRQARGNLSPLLNDNDAKNKHQASSSSSSAAAEIASEFYQDPWCQSTFLNFIKTLILRRNSITGINYCDDATILGWAPANEPQCLYDPGCQSNVLATWAHTIAAEIKKIDSNHLVFMDCEGFWGPTMKSTAAAAGPPPALTCSSYNSDSKSEGGNPYDCSYNGCDFLADCASPYIDVACCHLYPDLWLPNTASEENKVEFAVGWLNAHVEACTGALKKPLILSEFGKQRSTTTGCGREVYFQTVLSRCLEHMQDGKPLAGSLFWTAAAESYADYDGFTIYLPQKKQGREEKEGEGVAEVIREHAKAVQKLNERHSDDDGGQVLGGSDSRREGESSSIAQMVSKTKAKLESKLEKLKKKFSIK